jgi:DNA polymerase-3 subunit delta'
MGLFDDVIGQDRAVAQLRAAARAPVHAYLLVGPPGSGKRAAARSFAAALLCAEGGCGTCRDCRLAAAEQHPDLVVMERDGASISAEQCREMARLASLSPVEGRRRIIVAVDFHLVQDRAPILLKTIEEPPPGTVFVILADDTPPELTTIASRCVRIEFGPIPTTVLEAELTAGGIAQPVAAEIAEAAGGRLDRARLLASDPGFLNRRDVWRSVPRRLDGTGAAAAVVAAELLDVLETAAVDPLRARHAAEDDALEARVRQSGERGSGRKELADRHKRELRRLRTDELRFGLATLARVYRERLGTEGDVGSSLAALAAIDDAARELVRNPHEPTLIQALLVRLGHAGTSVPA